MPRKYNRKSGYVKKTVRKEIKRQIVGSAEPKNHYTSASLANIDYSGSLWTLSNPAQGQTAQTRIGDKLHAHHLEIRGLVTCASGGAYSTLRLVLFKWKDDTAVATPANNDILQNTYLANALAPFAPLTVGEERSHYTILADRTLNVSSASASRNFVIKKKLNYPVLFNDNATTGKNQIYLMVISGDGVTAYPQIEWVSNFTFKDV